VLILYNRTKSCSHDPVSMERILGTEQRPRCSGCTQGDPITQGRGSHHITEIRTRQVIPIYVYVKSKF